MSRRGRRVVFERRHSARAWSARQHPSRWLADQRARDAKDAFELGSNAGLASDGLLRGIAEHRVLFVEREKVVELSTPRRPDECPVEDWLSFLGHRWNPGILWHLSASARTFGELTGALPGITPKVLTERLKGLDQRSLVQRSPQSTFPRSVLYTLTTRGREVVEIIRPLEPWSKTSGATPD